MRRKKLTRDQREAACLLQIKRGTGWLIPEPLRSSGDAKAIIASVQYDHGTPHALTKDDRPQNLTPMIREDHAVKTAEIDVPAIAKSKRVARKHAEFRARILAKSSDDPDVPVSGRRSRKIASRPFPKPTDRPWLKSAWGKPTKKDRP